MKANKHCESTKWAMTFILLWAACSFIACVDSIGFVALKANARCPNRRDDDASATPFGYRMTPHNHWASNAGST